MPEIPAAAELARAAKVAFFRALFVARTDIYATRIENARTDWKGWLPAVRGGWQRGVPHARQARAGLHRSRLPRPAQDRAHPKRQRGQATGPGTEAA